MKQKFISNLILVIALNILIKPLYIFGIDRTVQNLVGPASYGLFFALFNFTYLFQMLNDFGIQNFNHSVFSKHPKLMLKYLPKIISTKLILGVLYITLVLVFAFTIGYKALLFPLLMLITCNHILTSFLLYFRTSLSANGYYRIDSWLSVADKFIMIFLVGYLIWFTDYNLFRIEWFVYSQSVSLFISILIASILIRMRLKIKSFRFTWDFPFMIWLLKKTIPYALVLLLMTMYTRMDAVMIERILVDGKKEAGIYAAAFRILDAVNMFGILFAGLLLPMFAKLIRKGQSVDGLVKTGFSLIWTIAVVVIAISWFWGQEIMILLYDGANLYWGKVYSLLMISYLAFSASYIYGTLLTANESIAKMNYVFVGGVILNLVLNIIFILEWKAWGAALATVITQFFVVSLLIWTARQELRLKINAQHIFKPGLYLICVLIMGRMILQLNLSWIMQILVLSGCALIFSVLFGQLPLKQSWKALNP